MVQTAGSAAAVGTYYRYRVGRIMTNTLSLIAGALAMMAMLVGCGGKGPTGQDTPKSTLKKAQSAIVAGDRAKFVECFTGPDGFDEFLDAGFDYARAVHRFYHELHKTVGPTAVQDLDRTTSDPSFFPRVPPENTDWIDSLDIKVYENTASYWDPYEDREAKLIRNNGTWYISLTDTLSDSRNAARLYKAMTAVVTEATTDVSKPGMNLQELKKRMGQRFFQVVQQASSAGTGRP